MITTHEQEIKQFQRLFKKEGVDQFDLRFKILKAFLKLEHHVTIREILDQLKKDKVSVDYDFVSDNMALLCRFGFANKIELENQEPLYEHRHLGVHHDHMVCTKCGIIIEFKDEIIENQQLKVADAYGFHMLQHKMEIYGICSECMASQGELVPLHLAKQGEKLIIKKLEAGQKMQLRISSMGLKVGDLVEIVSSGFGGQMVIATGENRLVIGRGIAEKIKVQYPELKEGKEGFKPPVMLSQMKEGQQGVIRKVSGGGILRRRLLEMGINRGSEIYVEKYAPLRDPIELVIKGYHLSLRVEEAANILVENVRFKKR